MYKNSNSKSQKLILNFILISIFPFLNNCGKCEKQNIKVKDREFTAFETEFIPHQKGENFNLFSQNLDTLKFRIHNREIQNIIYGEDPYCREKLVNCKGGGVIFCELFSYDKIFFDIVCNSPKYNIKFFLSTRNSNENESRLYSEYFSLNIPSSNFECKNKECLDSATINNFEYSKIYKVNFENHDFIDSLYFCPKVGIIKMVTNTKEIFYKN